MLYFKKLDELMKNKKLIALVILFTLTIFVSLYLAQIKINSGIPFYGDTGFYYILLNNIHSGLGPVNKILPSLLDYTFIKGLQNWDINQLCNFDLSSLSNITTGSNHFEFHLYPILYPISVLLYAFSAPLVTHFVDIFSFISFLLISYLILRKFSVPIIFASFATLMISLHPAWSWSILGQPFVDRIFLPFGLLAIYSLDILKSNRLSLIFFTICGLIVEKAIMYSGVFLLLHTLLNYRSLKNKDRIIRITFGILLIIIFEVVTKVYLTSNPYYASFIQFSLTHYINLLSDQRFINGIFSLLLLNGPILILIFWTSPKLFILTLVMMGPNLIGNIGGAEKTGYATHYHTLYFPFLVYAFCRSMGYLSEKSYFKKPFSVIMITSFLFINSFIYYTVDFTSRQTIFLNFQRNFSYFSGFNDFSKNQKRYESITKKIAENIPIDSRISSIEAGWPYLYLHRKVSIYPYDLKNSDFILMNYTKNEAGYSFSGFATFLGEDTSNKINHCLNDKITSLGFDITNPITLNENLAILRKGRNF
jgi:hypothetical protein